VTTSDRLLIIPPHATDLTGGPRTMADLAAELGRRGLPCLVIAPQRGSLTGLLEARQLDYLVVPPPASLLVREGRMQRFGLLPWLRTGAALLAYNGTVARAARRLRAGGILARGLRSVLLSGLAARWLGLPLIWDIGIEFQGGRAVRWLLQGGLRLATAVVLQSQSQAAVIFGPRAAARFAGKITGIHPGMECGHAPRGGRRTEPGCLEILSVGTILPRKNQALVIEALRLVGARYPGVRVRFAGSVYDQAYFERLQARVAEAGLERQVSFLGWRDDVPALLADSDLFVLPSRNEGLPRAVREALCAGVPAAVSAAGAMGEIITHGENGFLVDPDRPEELAAVIELCAAQPETAAAVGARGRAYAEQRLSLSAWGDQYYNLLRRLLPGAAPAP
jgi:glycosyltransferase involved in cell wall biosynthesis